jgi:hypothetical protein
LGASEATSIEVCNGCPGTSSGKHRLDRPASPQAADGTPLLHDNIRGSRYYH